MLDIMVPNGVSKMPMNLGELKHGSLRAAQWYSLFAFIIPLVILEIYVNDVEKLDPQFNQGQILKNIGYLVQCTNLVFSRHVLEWEANNFEVCYQKYHKTSVQIFGKLGMKPNHHYALHIPDQMRRWGPLGQVAEFAGERMIGFIQKIQTNTKLNHHWYIGLVAEMDKTMIYKTCQLQWLMSDYPVIEEYTNEKEAGGEGEPSRSMKNAMILGKEDYIALLNHVREEFPETRHHHHLPHPKNLLILRCWVIPKPFHQNSQKVLISVMKPNNCIKYTDNGKTKYGIITQIYEYKNPENKVKTMLKILPVTNLYPKDLESASHFFHKLCFLLKVVVGKVKDQHCYISPARVSCAACYRMLLPDTFQILESGIIIRPYDYESHLSMD
ncbi:hypothetical protein CROQUDRAFT_693264 [Cronartium quercuum f. sp. fusiforme G11]|uniref:Uncharacterized protein n=1 Tax=Cronartium quercuum f. sp. fusiforme G11 TaxID=708437 RepID=A0A9P6T5J7_9BASI|nr:hypothetical protein CROQUDRAFT_693264 [Cronartium quercuum f. sp. fusiforme G11]